MNEPDRPAIALPPDLAARLIQIDHGRNASKLMIFALIYLLSSALVVEFVQHLTDPLQWASLIPLWLAAAASLHGISLFTHEAVHGTLCRNRFLNNVFGALCAFPVLQTCRAYRVLHLKHHSHLGDAGDPDHYENYTHWTWMVFIMNWLRLLIGYPVYIVAIPILGFRQGTLQDRIWILVEIAALMGLMLVAVSVIPDTWLLHGWLIPMLLINTMVNIRGMSQHTLLEHAADEIKGTRTIRTNPVVRFFMCNENYHLEHHLYPRIPWHGLPQAHAALQTPLTAAGAPYIRSYAAFVGEFLIHSIRRSPLGRKAQRDSQ